MIEDPRISLDDLTLKLSECKFNKDLNLCKGKV